MSVAGCLARGGWQGCHEHASGYETVLVALVIAALIGACLVISIVLNREHRRPQPVADQWRALTVMGELCPHGWLAQITLRGWGAPVSAADAPRARAPLVELEWKQFDEESGRVAVARRVRAPTIGEALQAMVDDRRTDVAWGSSAQCGGRRSRVGRLSANAWWRALQRDSACAEARGQGERASAVLGAPAGWQIEDLPDGVTPRRRARATSTWSLPSSARARDSSNDCPRS